MTCGQGPSPPVPAPFWVRSAPREISELMGATRGHPPIQHCEGAKAAKYKKMLKAWYGVLPPRSTLGVVSKRDTESGTEGGAHPGPAKAEGSAA